MAETPAGNVQTTRYRFPFGLPAFEHLTGFRLLESPAWAPLAVLESESDPPVRFACAPVQLLMPGYRLELSDAELDALEWSGGGTELILLAVLTFAEGRPPTANLLAPIVLNPEAGTGVQSVQAHAAYSHVHPLRQEPPCL